MLPPLTRWYRKNEHERCMRELNGGSLFTRCSLFWWCKWRVAGCGRRGGEVRGEDHVRRCCGWQLRKLVTWPIIATLTLIFLSRVVYSWPVSSGHCFQSIFRRPRALISEVLGAGYRRALISAARPKGSAALGGCVCERACVRPLLGAHCSISAALAAPTTAWLGHPSPAPPSRRPRPPHPARPPGLHPESLRASSLNSQVGYLVRYIIVVLCFFHAACNPHGQSAVDAPLRLWYLPNAFWFLIEVFFYLRRRSLRLRFSCSFTAGRFLFRRVLLFVTRSILTIRSGFNEDVGVPGRPRYTRLPTYLDLSARFVGAIYFPILQTQL